MIAMHPGVLNLHGSLVDEDALQALGLAGERDSGQLSFVSARANQTGDGDELQNYSRISSVNRRFSFMPAAPSRVRMDRAVRPCLPMTLPRSLAATFNSSTVTCSPCTSLTFTSSGKSTRALAMSSMSCFIPGVPVCSLALRGLVIARSLAWRLTWEPRGILVDALAEAAFHSHSERNAVLAELVAQLVHGCHRVAPAIGIGFVEHVE